MAEKVFFLYGDLKVEVAEPVLTGAQIKSAIVASGGSFTEGHDLILEGHGNDQDQPIGDTTPVDLRHGHGEGPKHFHSRPPTNFG